MIATDAVFFAYIDPATGALVLQAIVASLLATSVIFRRFLVVPFVWLFRKLRGQDGSPDGSEGQG